MRTSLKRAPVGAALALVMAGTGLGSAAQARTTGAGAADASGAAAAAVAGPALTVDPTAAQHPISPDIYGLNFANEALAKELRLPVDRWGGNATTRYNYLTDSYNAGSDWYFENLHYNNPTAALPDGSQVDNFVDQNIRTGTKSLLTVPLIGWTASGRNDNCGFSVTKYGAQQNTDVWRPDCGNGTKPDGTTLVTGNDPADTSVPIGPDFTQGWVTYLKQKYGAASAGGVSYYDLDNEPQLWRWTHRDVHPAEVGWNEMRDDTYATAAALKQADPTAKTLGPAEWGYPALTYTGGGGCPGGCSQSFAQWYLQQMAAYEQQHGTRILDYFDIHLYPQENLNGDPGDAAMQALRLRSTRQLWDPTYVDESWLNQPLDFIPRLKSLIAQNYPGTKTAISEYGWGAYDSMNGGLAEGDILGIFGREGLDMATLWGTLNSTDPAAYAFRMYRNYDGQGGSFGDVSVQASSQDQGTLAVSGRTARSQDPRALDHLALSEGGHGRGGRRRFLLGEGGPEPSPGRSANHADEYGAAVEALHGCGLGRAAMALDLSRRRGRNEGLKLHRGCVDCCVCGGFVRSADMWCSKSWLRGKIGF